MNEPTNTFFEWIKSHAADNPTTLRLRYASKKADGMDYAAAVTQIECRRKFAAKLADTTASFHDFLYPSLLAGEQASSDLLAAYHASMLPVGQKVVDLTAGLGIDTFHLAKHASEVVAVELDSARAEALRFNARGLKLDNVRIVEGDCRDFIESAIASGERFDVAFIDPGRRDDAGRRVFALADCRPDVVELLPKIAQMCNKLIVKASPMLDVSNSAESLGPSTKCAIAVGTPTDCKELLLEVDFGNTFAEPFVQSVVLSKDFTLFHSFLRSEENAAPMPISDIPLKAGDYLYEAYPELMKTGGFRLLAAQYGLSVISANTRLFYSEKHTTAFPGHVYRVLEVLPYASKIIKRFKKDHPQVSVAVRNFGISADALRKRLGVVDGGPLRLYGFTDASGNRQMALTENI